MSETTRAAAAHTTAAQRIVTAMATLDQPATAKQIATAADVGYSTISPVLRNLLADGRAAKSQGDDGSTLWRLDSHIARDAAADPTGPAGAPHDPTGADADGGNGGAADNDHRHDDAVEHTDVDTVASSAPHDTGDQHHDIAPSNDGDDVPDNSTEPEPEPEPAPTDPADGEPQPTAPAKPQPTATAEPQPTGPDANTAPTTDADTPAATSRAYRKPVKPRRHKGALRTAIHAVLAGERDRAFRVGEMCKVIDGADPDGMFNKAGPGAVVNALDKLATDGDAERVSESPASYRFRAKPADADSPS